VGLIEFIMNQSKIKTDFVTDSPRMWTFDHENLQEIASFHCLLTFKTVRKPRETNTSKTWFSTFFLFFFLNTYSDLPPNWCVLVFFLPPVRHGDQATCKRWFSEDTKIDKK